MSKNTWREKLVKRNDLPRVVPIPAKMQSRLGTGTMVVPSPVEVDEIMRQVPRGKLITINDIRARLAQQHGTDTACPMTTGIFAWIAAHAAEEAAAEGADEITPYWRTLKAGGELNPKYPGGVEHQKRLLESEGHRVVQKGKKWVVENLEAARV